MSAPRPVQAKRACSAIRSRHRAAAWALLVLGSAALAQMSASPGTAPSGDASLGADPHSFEAVQSRIQALEARASALAGPHLAKARCWLDVGSHEHHRNDRGAFAQQALRQSDALLRALEQGLPVPTDTPLVAGAERLRPDLWQRTAALRGHSGSACAQARAGCAEVELVHAGHEHAQLGWRYAKPYVQIAEDLVVEAESLAQACPSVRSASNAASPVITPTLHATRPLQPRVVVRSGAQPP